MDSFGIQTNTNLSSLLFILFLLITLGDNIFAGQTQIGGLDNFTVVENFLILLESLERENYMVI